MFGNLFNKNSESFKQINTFCLFIGYPRSGHTLYGALLDAHPNCIVSHELNVLRLLKEGKSKKQIFNKILKNSQENIKFGRENEGYKYEVQNQWQGKYININVIGDKQGGRTSRMLSTEPGLLNRLSDKLNIKIKILHVFRNPFDNIASRSRGGKLNKKDSSIDVIKSDIEKHFIQLNTNNKIRKKDRFEVLDIQHENFISAPEVGLKRICDFLGLATTIEYLKDCASIVFQNPHKTRFDIDFPKEQKKIISDKIKGYDFLSGYLF